MLTKRFVRQIPARKKGPNLKTKDLQTHVFWTYVITLDV
jgi:hypothetical protein